MIAMIVRIVDNYTNNSDDSRCTNYANDSDDSDGVNTNYNNNCDYSNTK